MIAASDRHAADEFPREELDYNGRQRGDASFSVRYAPIERTGHDLSTVRGEILRRQTLAGDLQESPNTNQQGVSASLYLKMVRNPLQIRDRFRVAVLNAGHSAVTNVWRLKETLVFETRLERDQQDCLAAQANRAVSQ